MNHIKLTLRSKKCRLNISLARICILDSKIRLKGYEQHFPIQDNAKSTVFSSVKYP